MATPCRPGVERSKIVGSIIFGEASAIAYLLQRLYQRVNFFFAVHFSDCNQQMIFQGRIIFAEIVATKDPVFKQALIDLTRGFGASENKFMKERLFGWQSKTFYFAKLISGIMRLLIT